MSSPTTPTKSDRLDKEAANLTPKWKKDELLSEFKIPPLGKDQKKRLILDEDKFESAFLKCMVCQEVFDRVNHVPKLLNCQHNVCLACLLEMFRVESEFRVQMTSAFRSGGPSAVKVTCPACRESVVKSETEIRSMTTDVTLLELGEFIRGSERCVVSFCGKHPRVPMNFYCDSCHRQVCSECTSREHGYGHDVIGLETAVRETEPDISATLDVALAESSNIGRTRHALESVVRQLDSAKETISRDIFETFDTFGTSQSSRAEQLVEMSQVEIDCKREYLVSQLQEVRKREAELSVSTSLLQEARMNGDLDQMFVHHKIIKQTLSERGALAICDEDDLRCLLSFIHDEISESSEEVQILTDT